MNDEFNYFGSLDVAICEDQLSEEEYDWLVREMYNFQRHLEQHSECISVTVDVTTNWGQN